MITKTTKPRRWLVLPLLYGCVAALIGCSAALPPTDAISTADMAVNRALEAKAAELAPLDLRIARDKLNLAKSNMDKENYTQARRQAEDARVDARVEEAKSKAKTAADNTREVQQSLQDLHHDIQQKTAD